MDTRVELELAIIDWRNKRTERLRQEKVAEETKKEESTLLNEIVEFMNSNKIEGVVVGGRITSVSPKDVPVVENREAFIEYIFENMALELLQFRLSTTAIKEREEAGVEIPGIGHLEVYSLSDKKV